MTTLLLAASYLCPGTPESGAHVTDNPRQCGCGNSNLTPLASILDRGSSEGAQRYLDTYGTIPPFSDPAAGRKYDGIGIELPTLHILFAEGDA